MFLTLAVRLLVREVPLERCVLVPHASELAFFPVGGRRRGRPELRRKTIARLRALERGTAAAVRTLISAGAVDFDRALDLAITNGKRRSCAQLLRAGAALPAVITAQSPDGEMPGFPQTRAYIETIRAAGGYKAYEKAHRQRLTVIFLEKFPALPVEMLGRVLEFTWDIGGH